MSDSSQQDTQTMQQLIINIINDDSMHIKVNSACKLFQNHAQHQDFETFSKDLANVLPEITLLQQCIFQHNDALIDESTAPDVVNIDILNELQEYLKMSIELLKAIHYFLSIIANKGVLDVQCFCFIPININHLLCATFYHCKESQKTYKNYFDKIQIHAELFQCAQLIHQKLLTSVESQFTFQVSKAMHQDLLVEFLDGLSDTGSLLFGLNSKLMVTTWRCYANLIKQYGATLTNVELIKPVMILFSEISLTLRKAIQAQSQDVQAFKICNFLLRIATTIVFTFWNTCAQSENAVQVFGLISNLYKLTATASMENAKFCEEHIHAQLDTMLVRFFIDPSVLIMDALRECDDCQGFGIAVRSVMPRAKLFNTRGVTCNILKLYFAYVKSLDAYEFNQSEDYALMLVNFAAGILGTAAEEYHEIEEVFLGNMLQEPALSLSAIFACDLWILILSLAPPTLCMDTLSTLADKYKTRAPIELRRGACHLLRLFMRRCFARLPDALKARWMETYTAEAHLNLWALAGVGEAAPAPSQRRAYLAQVIARNVCRRCEPMQQDDLQYAMDGLEVLSALSTPGDPPPPEIQRTLSALVAKWFRTDAALLASEAYGNYLTNALLPAAVCFIGNLRFDNAHLLQILTLLLTASGKQNSSPVEKALISVIIAPIARTNPEEYNALVFCTLGKLLDALKLPVSSPFALRDCSAQDAECQIVNLYANTARAAFEASGEWMKNLAIVSVSSAHKKRANSPPPAVEPAPAQTESESEPKLKKIKLQKGRALNARYIPHRLVSSASTASASKQRPEDEAQDILDHMKDEVQKLQKLARNGKWAQFSKENSKDVQQIVTKLQQLMYRS